MQNRFKISVAALAFAFAAVTSAFPAAAVAPKDAAVVCDLKDMLAQLAQFQADGSASSTAAELALRKEIMARSMECSTREARTLAGSVKSIEGVSSVSNVLKNRYVHALGSAAAHTESQERRIGALASVTSSKDLARELRDWRAATYNPIAWEASQLIVLDRNLVLAASAKERRQQLEFGMSEGESEVAANLAEASVLIESAESQLEGAIVLLRDEPKTAQERITSAQKEGLDALSQAYAILLDANEQIAAEPAE